MKKRALFIILILFIVISLGISMGVYALFSTTSSRGVIEATSISIDASATYTSSANPIDFTFDEKASYGEVNISLENNSDMNLHRYYTITYKNETDELAPAILVYYNGKFVSSLACDNF